MLYQLRKTQTIIESQNTQLLQLQKDLSDARNQLIEKARENTELRMRDISDDDSTRVAALVGALDRANIERVTLQLQVFNVE